MTPETQKNAGVKEDAPPVQNETKYVALMETNGKECESWLYFIKYDENVENLEHLQKQLEKVDWFIIEDLSTFDLDLEHFVSESTAKEMTTLDLNSYAFHRKFDGPLRKIDLGFRPKDDNETKICKAFDILSYGQIEDFVDDEDIDSDDIESSDESEPDEPKSQQQIDEEWIPPALRRLDTSKQQRAAQGKKKCIKRR